MARHYKLEYLPIFWEDLRDITFYIRDVLGSPLSAAQFLDDVETRILEQLETPETAPIYPSTRERQHPYYWFSVGKYMIFYIIQDDVVEVRRCLYGGRNIKPLV